ncbi:hypothetical protein PV783_20805 [Chitinophaga sp. CC14]|uniref:hypothetical protein n=1 Tax=Chitinophaga sp. CC14 TaxID=3029199 RepID=UPI003B771871
MQITNNSAHHLFISDAVGLASIFPLLKQTLAVSAGAHVSLLYSSAQGDFHFKKELVILQSRYATQLFVYYISGSDTEPGVDLQKEIEAAINANTKPCMEFTISGNKFFTGRVEVILRFLGIQNYRLQEQYFKE